MIPSCTSSVAVLVATARRPHLLASRSLPSIESQTRTPGRVVVVDDAHNDAAARQTEQTVRAWQPAGIAVDFLRNRRTRGAAGAWNSGLDHLLRTCGDPRQLYVAILDDDDRWEPGHLERCLTLARSHDLDMIAAPFLRFEDDAAPRLVIPPRCLEAESFLVGNPGIQGSNLVCRLSVLLEAGLFDESLPSCTDRDLCIRISDLPGCTLRRHRSYDRSSFRLLVTASVVHAAVTGPAGRTRRLLPQIQGADVRRRACPVPGAGVAAVRLGGTAAQARPCGLRARRIARTATIRVASGSASPDRGDDCRYRSARRGARPARRLP